MTTNQVLQGSSFQKQPGESVDQDFLLPALLIRDARTGHFIRFNSSNEKAVRSYAIYTNRAFTLLMKLAVFALMALVLCEEPAMPRIGLPLWATLTVEVICLGFMGFRLIHRLKFTANHTISKDGRYVSAWVIIGATVTDIIVNLAWMQFANSTKFPRIPRFSRVLRPALCMCFPVGSAMYRIFRNVRRALPDVFALLSILVAGVSFFAIMTTKVFGPRRLVYSDDSPYMVNFLDTWWDYYVLMTTANNPDVMLPALDFSKWRAMIFIIFLLLVMYVFMNLTLATLYSNYKENLKEDVQLLVYRKRARMAKVFDLLKQWHGQLNAFVVTYDTWYRLIHYTYPKMKEDMIKVYFLVLTDGESYITKANILSLSDLLNEYLEPAKHDPTCCEKTFGPCYTSKCNTLFRDFIKSKFFRYFIDALIVANTITIAVDYNSLEWAFLIIFTLEIVFKMWTLGLKVFLASFWNWLDLIIIAAAVIVTLIMMAIGTGKTSQVDYLESILILRLLRLLRLLGVIDRFKVILRTITKTVPPLAAYSVAVFAFYYVWAILGMELFKNQINFYGYDVRSLDEASLYCGNPKLKDTEFYIKRYCNLNFNNFFNSVVTMFGLMVVNQWHVVAQGYEFIAGKSTRIYFITFHVCVVIILMNIFTGIVLEVFALEYAVKDTDRMDSSVEKKIRKLGLGVDAHEHAGEVEGIQSEKAPLKDGPKPPQPPSIAEKYGLENVRFKIKTSGGKSTLQMLQTMFESELDTVRDDGTQQLTGAVPTQMTKEQKTRQKLMERATID